jgi:hypothetical protein
MCCAVSDSLALFRAFSGALARVNYRILILPRSREISPRTNGAFAGLLQWAVKDSNLRPWD